LTAPLGGPAYLRLILIGAGIGIPAALIGVGFIAVVHELEHLLWEEIPNELGRDSPPWYLILGLPVLGAGIVALARIRLPGDGGHRPVDGLSSEPMPAEYGPGVALAALGSLPFGAVLGPEAPLIGLGSVAGTVVARRVNLPPRESTVLATAGSFAAIATIFGGPIPAGVIMVEAGISMGAALIPALIPGVVAAAVGYLIFTGFGNWSGLKDTVLQVPGLPDYTVHLHDLVIAVAVGVLAAVLSWAVWRLAARASRLEEGPLGTVRLLLGGAALVGVLALVADALGADPQDVLFSGQSSLPSIVAEGSAGVVLVLVAAKGLAYAISLGCGFRGGPIFPAIFLGVALAVLAVIAFDASPTLAVAVGTAAGMAAATRLIFSSLVVAALLVGSNGADAVPAAVLAAAAAWVTISALDPAPRPDLPATEPR
jgi:H+/Cl- antiporter ClcA